MFFFFFHCCCSGADSKPFRKVKTGCLTCKIRHLKCDETKPHCLRCLKFGVECDFYLTKAQQGGSTFKSNAKPLVPRPSPSHTIFYPLSQKLFSDEQEQRYFRFFCDKTSQGLSGYFDSALWSELVLQACENDSAIRHAVVAIGALDLTSKRSTSRIQAHQILNDDAEQDHRFALQQYGLAIKRMRESTSEKKVDLRTMLIGCILLTCFETFHGNHQSAIAQMQSGLSLLEDWHAQHTPNLDEVLGTSSPSPFVVDDEILQALGRLDLQSMTFLDPRPKEIHNRMRRYGQASINAMPETFATLKEARVYLELVMRRFMHFMISISNVEGSDGVMKLSDPLPDIPEFILADQRRHMKELQRWHSAFMPLLKYARTVEGKKNFLAATALETHYLSSYFGLDAMTLDSRSSASRSMPVFREIVSLCTDILSHPSAIADETKYTFDLQIVASLYATGLRCRHSGIRRQAVALLLSSPRREGVWDAVLAGKIVGWVADIEEEDGLDGEFMKEGKGIIDLKFDFNLQARSVYLQCLQIRTGSDILVEREATLTW